MADWRQVLPRPGEVLRGAPRVLTGVAGVVVRSVGRRLRTRLAEASGKSVVEVEVVEFRRYPRGVRG